jgi:hypothetical protein
MRGINREAVRKMLVEYLKKKRICARFVVQLVTLYQKHQGAASSVGFDEMTGYDRNGLMRIVTGDEILCFTFDPQTKRQSEYWPKKPKTQKMGMQKFRVKKNVDFLFLC